MTTSRKIVDMALRRLGILGGNGATATPDQSADGLLILAGLYRSLINSAAFGRITDVIPTGPYTAGENERVYRTDPAVTSISLPMMVTGARTESCDYGRRTVSFTGVRPVRDCAVVVVVDQVSGGIQDYIYDGQRKLWFTLNDIEVDYVEDDGTVAGAAANAASLATLNLALDQECPLSYRDASGLASYLATHIADEYGSPVPPMTAQLSRNFLINLQYNYSSVDYNNPQVNGAGVPLDNSTDVPIDTSGGADAGVDDLVTEDGSDITTEDGSFISWDS